MDFDFFGEKKDEKISAFLSEASLYANTEREGRLSVLFVSTVSEGQGFQASMIIVHALTCAQKLNKHSDAEFNAMIENRDTEDCLFDSFDNMGMGDVFTFCKAMEIYALNSKNGDKNGISLEEWAWILPKDKKEAKFVVQLLCDGGINKYGLSCAGLTENLLKDIEPAFGLATHAEVDEELAKLEKEGEIE
ncbi:hP0423 family protein [Helicobacter pylori]|nr:hP0423 family protein [Helicobacter pylori]BAW41603.1 hP0423 family protein [Helicobacter pylori]